MAFNASAFLFSNSAHDVATRAILTASDALNPVDFFGNSLESLKPLGESSKFVPLKLIDSNFDLTSEIEAPLRSKTPPSIAFISS